MSAVKELNDEELAEVTGGITIYPGEYAGTGGTVTDPNRFVGFGKTETSAADPGLYVQTGGGWDEKDVGATFNGGQGGEGSPTDTPLPKSTVPEVNPQTIDLTHF